MLLPLTSARAGDCPTGPDATDGDKPCRVDPADRDETDRADAADRDEADRVDAADRDEADRVDAADRDETDRAWTPPIATLFAALSGRTVSQAGRAMQLWYHGQLSVTTSGGSGGSLSLGEERRSGVGAPQRPPIPSPLAGEG